MHLKLHNAFKYNTKIPKYQNRYMYVSGKYWNFGGFQPLTLKHVSKSYERTES